MLQGSLTYNVVPRQLSAADLMRRIAAGRGSTGFTTVTGATLTARMMGGTVMLIGAKSSMAHVTQADVIQSNGVIHVTDSKSLPG